MRLIILGNACTMVQMCMPINSNANSFWIWSTIYGWWITFMGSGWFAGKNLSVGIVEPMLCFFFYLLNSKYDFEFKLVIAKWGFSDIILYQSIFNMSVEWKINEKSPKLYQLFHLIFECDVIVVNQTPISLVNPLILKVFWLDVPCTRRVIHHHGKHSGTNSFKQFCNPARRTWKLQC